MQFYVSAFSMILKFVYVNPSTIYIYFNITRLIQLSVKNSIREFGEQTHNLITIP